MNILWLALLVSFLILEAATTQFICIWFAGGSLFAFISALLGFNQIIQISVFVISSVLLLIFTKKIVDRLKTKTPLKTNADAVIGKTAVVTEDISNLDSKGSVKLGGIEWSARSSDDSLIAAKSHVIVREIDGVKLIVDKLTL